jgi:hypothetical protein
MFQWAYLLAVDNIRVRKNCGILFGMKNWSSRRDSRHRARFPSQILVKDKEKEAGTLRSEAGKLLPE